MNLGLQANQSRNTSRQYNIATDNQAKSSKRLSSGYRINAAADDAAGLAISEKMRKQIRGLDVADRNIQDGTSYVQTADAALSEVQSMLHRISELSIQSANDTNTAADRIAIDNEVQELKKEIDHIFSDTRFNTMQIWGEDNAVSTPIGVQEVRSVTPVAVSDSFTITETSKWAVPKLSYKVNADTDGYWVTWTGYNGTSYSTTKTAWPDETTWPRDATTGKLSNDESLSIKIDSSTLDLTTYPELQDFDLKFNYKIARDSTIQDIIDSINDTNISTSNSAAVNITYTQKANSVSADNPLTLSVSAALTYAAFLYADRTFGVEDDGFIEPDPTTTRENYTASTGSDNYTADFVMGTSKDNTPDAIANAAHSSWNVTATSANSYIRLDAYTNYYKYEDQVWWYQYYSNGRLMYNTNEPNLGDGTLDTIQTANDFAITNHLRDGSSCTGRLLFNLTTTDSGYQTLADGTNHAKDAVGSLNIYINNITTATTDDQIKEILDSINGMDLSGPNFGYGTASVPSYAISNATRTVNIDQTIYDHQIGLHIQSSDMAYDSIDINYHSLRTGNLGIADTSVKTRSDASDAITATADALAIVSAQRSLFGAYENRFEHARANVTNTAENVQTSESRIRDTDMAEEMVSYSTSRILMQAGESILAQQNSSMSQILSLLQ